MQVQSLYVEREAAEDRFAKAVGGQIQVYYAGRPVAIPKCIRVKQRVEADVQVLQ
uniref:Uncharacterized protein n=1 Tax=Anguilla anguilla TaxID=7936 RepID=A0A0E9Q6E4_ANGAN